jgi:ribosomal protein S6--L-glutamate ligase
MMSPAKFVAIEGRLKKCKNVITLGAKPNFSDYTGDEQQLIYKADTIYYPSVFYAPLFDAMGKKTFPSPHSYQFAQDKIKQTALFTLLNIPHPRTRVFYGSQAHQAITKYFAFPFIGKIPRGSALGRGVYLITDQDSLMKYCQCTHAAYIQEYFPIDRDIRIVVIGQQPVLAYWRIAATGEFRTNVFAGASVSLETVPDEAVDLALDAAKKCRWDDVGIDVICHQDRFYVIEGNMKYGKAGFMAAGVDYYKMMEEKMENGEI